MKQRDVCWLSLPYSSLETGKHRPALVVSNDSYNSASEDVLVCAITSNPAARPYSIKLSKNDFAEGSLPLESRVRPDKLVSVHKSLLTKKLGSVSPGFFSKVFKEITGLVRND